LLVVVENATEWIARVSAYAQAGYSSYTNSNPSRVVLAPSVPTVPQNVSVAPVSPTALVVRWNCPLSTGGLPLGSFQVQWDVIDTFDSVCGDLPEIQTIRVLSKTPLSHETFAFAIGGIYVPKKQSCFSWNSSASQLQSGLRTSDSRLSAVTVTRGGDGLAAWEFGYTWSITFLVAAPTSNAYVNWEQISLNFTTCNRGNATWEVKVLHDGAVAWEAAPHSTGFRSVPLWSQKQKQHKSTKKLIIPTALHS